MAQLGDLLGTGIKEGMKAIKGDGSKPAANGDVKFNPVTDEFGNKSLQAKGVAESGSPEKSANIVVTIGVDDKGQATGKNTIAQDLDGNGTLESITKTDGGRLTKTNTDTGKTVTAENSAWARAINKAAEASIGNDKKPVAQASELDLMAELANGATVPPPAPTPAPEAAPKARKR